MNGELSISTLGLIIADFRRVSASFAVGPMYESIVSFLQDIFGQLCFKMQIE